MTTTRGLLLLATVTVGCAPASMPSVTGDGLGPITESPAGKTDNYRSTIGREFKIEGQVVLRLEGQDTGLYGDELDARLAELSRTKVEDITRALDAKLHELWPESRRGEEKNIIVMIRAATPQATQNGQADEFAYAFTYSAEAAGPTDMLDRLGLDTLYDGQKGVTLTLGDQSTVELVFTADDRTDDSYPQYNDIFADGRLDIGILVGGDHYTPRNDVNEATAIYNELVALGLTPPVERFADLSLESSTFTGSFVVNVSQPEARERVEVNVRLVYADLGTAEQLVDAYKAMAAADDIVVYRGHAGTSLTYSGVVVQYQPARVAIAASEFRNLELPDKYQVFVFDGCETYTGYADQLYAHESKDETNADVITSVNFGSGLGGADTVLALLRGVFSKRDNTWLPLSWDGLLTKINDSTSGRWTPIYGVHGLDDNPRLSPLADFDSIGRDCEQKSDCPGVDNLCVQRTGGGSRCAAACTASSACPEGTECRQVNAEWLGHPLQCL